MPCRPYKTTLSLDVVGFPVPNRAVLRTVLHALTVTDLTSFAVETGPEDTAIVYVTPQAVDRLTEIIRQTAEPSTHQLQAIFRAQARTLFHDEGVLEIDDDAPVSISPEERGRGAYVQAWAWVDKRAEAEVRRREGAVPGSDPGTAQEVGRGATTRSTEV